MYHCLNYLCETVLCTSDVMLETSIPKLNPLGKEDNRASGLGIDHRCRDWVQVREYLEMNWENYQKEI